ncbi:hypothetical protein [Komagataeibacter sp. FNDCF1]|uniref:hypothetical protein n=1 Tax=Komagataeibacter sp. FNDCF1 TaxID=2878681 RepID=UPI001E539066|nr:hypothetical protein [Komagataeibacter sp. FNDCF1]MCE2563197.1 hypothetical protein [Komagataeibacter sp. FNDCF1]
MRETNRNIVYGTGFRLDGGGYYFVCMNAPDASATCIMDNDLPGNHGVWSALMHAARMVAPDLA